VRTGSSPVRRDSTSSIRELIQALPHRDRDLSTLLLAPSFSYVARTWRRESGRCWRSAERAPSLEDGPVHLVDGGGLSTSSFVDPDPIQDKYSAFAVSLHVAGNTLLVAAPGAQLATWKPPVETKPGPIRGFAPGSRSNSDH
jgi:hypothetical protein